MSLLIRGGTLLTITEQGSFQGDLRVQDGIISEIAAFPKRIPPDDKDTVLDANSLYITPGYIDLYINTQAEEPEDIIRLALSSGITTMLIWNDSPRCTLYTQGSSHQSQFVRIETSHCTDAQLDQQLHHSAEQGLFPVIDVTGEAICRQVLLSTRRTGIRPLLFRLSGCRYLAGAIAESGCAAIPAPYGMCGSSPWQLSVKLNELGTSTALTCAYPYTRMKHLPLCTALCVREGMARSEALKTITTVPASLLGLAGVGRLAPGFHADINIYDGDPLLIATSLVATITGGKFHHRLVSS